MRTLSEISSLAATEFNFSQGQALVITDHDDGLFYHGMVYDCQIKPDCDLVYALCPLFYFDKWAAEKRLSWRGISSGLCVTIVRQRGKRHIPERGFPLKPPQE